MKKMFMLFAVALSVCIGSEAQTATSLFWKKDGKQVSEIVSDKADQYNKVGHHGPAVENTHFALRIYFNNSGAVDVYSKTGRGLELEQYKWYPTAKQQEDEGAGCDLFVEGRKRGVLEADGGGLAHVWPPRFFGNNSCEIKIPIYGILLS